MLRLYDTLSRSAHEFQPLDGQVKLYVCGLTPYDATHLGHAFTMVAFDVLIRYLRYLGNEVHYVQNVTDVDDPLFEKARQLGVSYRDLAAEETERYVADMRDLNVLPPEEFPRASREIPEMIEIVKLLFEAGHAYQVDGYVYFDIATDRDYGKLSKYDRTTMLALARERGGNPDDPSRRHPLDFVLWRPSQPDEPTADSPWGPGLPGWHLECSAMSLEYLGAPLDIHGGGADLIFPHHENEIAQSEGATGVHPFARFWMHTGMVYLDGEKMSKSLGNMVFVRDLLPRYGPDAVRLYLLGCHYRAQLHYDPDSLTAAARQARDLAHAAALPTVGGVKGIDVDAFRARFEERMNDDLDTPGAVAVLEDLATAIGKGRRRGHDLTAPQRLLRELAGVLGLRLDARSLPNTYPGALPAE